MFRSPTRETVALTRDQSRIPCAHQIVRQRMRQVCAASFPFRCSSAAVQNQETTRLSETNGRPESRRRLRLRTGRVSWRNRHPARHAEDERGALLLLRHLCNARSCSSVCGLALHHRGRVCQVAQRSRIASRAFAECASPSCRALTTCVNSFFSSPGNVGSRTATCSST